MVEATSDVDAMIRALYGADAPAQLRNFHGLLHVAAVWAGAPSWPAILIRPDGPRSASDRFVLELARARADAIVITGKIMREEPELRFDEPGAGTPHQAALTHWRRAALGRREPPLLAILSSGRDLDLDRPLLRSWARPLLVVAESHAQSLRQGLAARGLAGRVELCAQAEPSLEGTVELLRGRGCETISLEAGPQTLAPLYGPEHALSVDELLLSLFHGPLPEHLRAAGFVSEPRARALFERVSAAERQEQSGRWSFTRWQPRG